MGKEGTFGRIKRDPKTGKLIDRFTSKPLTAKQVTAFQRKVAATIGRVPDAQTSPKPPPVPGSYGRVAKDATSPTGYVDRITRVPLTPAQRDSFLARARGHYKDTLGFWSKNKALIGTLVVKGEAKEDAVVRVREASRVADSEGIDVSVMLMLTKAARTISQNPRGLTFRQALERLIAWHRGYISNSLTPFPEEALYPG